NAVAAERLLHVVSLKFKPSASAEDIKKVEASFRALKTKIPQIKTLEWGTNVSPEKLNKGFTHCWVLSFSNEKDRDAYLVHPEHKAFGKSLGPVLEDVFVIDFWAKD
ncbi:MAG TPA: Dabb family protein, partial [Candidatus Sulfotelmatobacter sp.]|nr:Dabb family protein [Candidatus Sulfotelmatobacter sp.]